MVFKSIFMPVMEDSRISELDDIKDVEETSNGNNIIDLDVLGKEYLNTKVEVSVPLGMAPEDKLIEKPISKVSTVFNLHEIFSVDAIRKTMINNPLKGVVKKQTLCVKEGNDLDGSSAVTEVDVEDKKKCKRIILNVFDEEPLVPMSMSYESLFMQVIEDSKFSGLEDIKEFEEALHGINIVDIDSLDEEHAFANVNISGPLDMVQEEELDEKLVSKGPAVFSLHGIFIVDGIGKAMIDIPFKGIGKKQTLYIEEGDELDGCRVARIYKEGIRLDCQGKERVVTLNSEIKDYKQENYVAEGQNKTMEKTEAEEEFISEKDNKEVDGSRVVAVVDDEDIEKGKQIMPNVFDDDTFNPLSMAYESLFVPASNDVKISESNEIQEVAETLLDSEVVNIDHSGEEQKFAMAEPSVPNYNVLEEEKLTREVLSKVPTQIILKGIVIAGNIKKALVNVPMPNVRKNRSLYVEEGDGLEGYLVTKIEPAQIRLARQGEERIVKFSSLF